MCEQILLRVVCIKLCARGWQGVGLLCISFFNYCLQLNHRIYTIFTNIIQSVEQWFTSFTLAAKQDTNNFRHPYNYYYKIYIYFLLK